MRKFNIFQGIYMIFFSKEFYRDVAKNWRGMAILFLIILTFISSAATIITVDRYISKFISKVAPEIIHQVPPVVIKNGKIQTPQKKVYSISYKADEDSFLCIIDTTGKHRSIEKSGADILITETHLMVKKSDNEVRSYSLADAEDLEITRDDLKNIIEIFSSWYLILIAPLIIFFIIIYKLILMLVYSVVALIANAVTNKRLDYGALLSVSAVAMGPILIADTIFELAVTSISIPWYAGLIVTGGYIIFMINSLEDVDDGKEGEAPPAATEE